MFLGTIRIFFVTALSGFFLTLFLFQNSPISSSPTPIKDDDHSMPSGELIPKINLYDPEQAPSYQRKLVMHGYRLMCQTRQYAPHFVGNHLVCSNCHFGAGDTLGGKNGGISLVGCAHQYPRYSEREKKQITLTDRITQCFRRSMNGTAPQPEHIEMRALIAYLHWISSGVPREMDPTWTGLPEISSTHIPDPINGEKLYIQFCASCHQMDGGGSGTIEPDSGKVIPPLWGPHAFNDGAGMSKITMFAPFIFMNMPYENACLTEEQALDISAFVLQKPRPHLNP